MSFKEYGPSASRARDRIAMRVRCPRGRNISLEWVLGGGTCEALEWKSGDRIMVSFGEAEHLGKAHFEKHTRGYKLTSRRQDTKGEAKKIRMNNVPHLMDKTERPMTDLKWRRTGDGNTIEVDLPDDFYMQFQDVKRA